MADTQSLLVAEGLGRDFGELKALDSLDLDLSGGQAVALIGHNGSGKTTALSMLAGRLEPSRGTVRVAGVDINRHGGSATVRAVLSFIPDTPALYPDLTVADHLDLIGLAHGLDDVDERTGTLLGALGLADRSHLLPRELSRGMRQKTQLACGLLRPYEVLLLDEPVSGLDPPSRHALHMLLKQIKSEGALVVFSTHDLEFARDLADQIVVLRDGQVLVAGTYDDVSGSGHARELGLG
jgi:ABC-2 type transport system ATP-binding protein